MMMKLNPLPRARILIEREKCPSGDEPTGASSAHRGRGGGGACVGGGVSHRGVDVDALSSLRGEGLAAAAGWMRERESKTCSEREQRRPSVSDAAFGCDK